MKIILVGLKRTGFGIIKAILDEGHDLTVIDKSQEAVDKATDKYNVCGFCGSGASKTVLSRAGAETTDIIIAATETDEVNLMCCMIAKSLGVGYAVSVIRSPDFINENDYIRNEFGISCVINPELDTATEIAKLIKLPVNIKVEAFFSGDTTIAEIPVSAVTELDGKAVSTFKDRYPDNMLVCSVVRGNDVFVPNGDFILKAGDVIDIISSQNTLVRFCEQLGIIRKPVRSVMMVGCGTIGMYLAKQLCDMHIKVKIIDFKKERCAELLTSLPDAQIVYGDGVESGLLTEEGIKKYDACISLTGADETNLVVAMFAWSCGVHPIITKILSPSYAEILRSVSIDYTVSPALTTARNLLCYIRLIENRMKKQQGEIKALYKLSDGKTEAVEFIADGSFPFVNVSFDNEIFRLKKNTLIAAIIRDGNMIIPNGRSSIKVNDRVIVLTLHGYKYNRLEECFDK